MGVKGGERLPLDPRNAIINGAHRESLGHTAGDAGKRNIPGPLPGNRPPRENTRTPSRILLFYTPILREKRRAPGYLSESELLTTDTELNAIAAPATTGERNPAAASGRPTLL